jgi:hypothetical protein
MVKTGVRKKTVARKRTVSKIAHRPSVPKVSFADFYIEVSGLRREADPDEVKAQGAKSA